MKAKAQKYLYSLAAVAVSMCLSNCGGNGTVSPALVGSGGPPPQVTVAITPPNPTLFLGDSQQFTATVTGTSNTAVTWSVSSNSSGNIGSISTSGLYQAPSSLPLNKIVAKPGGNRRPGESSVTIFVTATSKAEPDATGSATITLENGED